MARLKIERRKKARKKMAQALLLGSNAPLDEARRGGYHNSSPVLLLHSTRLALENLVINSLCHHSILGEINHVGLDRPTPHHRQVGGIWRCRWMSHDYLVVGNRS